MIIVACIYASIFFMTETVFKLFSSVVSLKKVNKSDWLENLILS